MEHKSRKHALLSASGSKRWINCTPSPRMEEEMNLSDESSVYAAEGTLAHEFGDLILKMSTHIGPVGVGTQYGAWKAEYMKLKNHELYDPEMDGYVAIYTDYVLQEFAAAKKRTPGAILKIEEKTDYSYLVPEGFGTSDANIIADGVLEIADLKYGKGVKVDAQGNTQTRLYALGLLRKFDLLYDIHTVKMTIVQPRLGHIDSEVVTVEDLHKWAEEVVKPAAEKAFEGEGECNPGDWCQWCKAKPICRALADQNLELAKSEFADPKTLDDSELVKVYGQIDLLTSWANAVAKYMLDEAVKGKSYEGLKVVEGRAVRKWADETKAINTLSKKGYKPEEIINTKIKGIGDVEKLVGKADFAKLGLVIKPQGKPTLVPESDKRPAIGLAQARKEFE